MAGRGGVVAVADGVGHGGGGWEKSVSSVCCKFGLLPKYGRGRLPGPLAALLKKYLRAPLRYSMEMYASEPLETSPQKNLTSSFISAKFALTD